MDPKKLPDKWSPGRAGACHPWWHRLCARLGIGAARPEAATPLHRRVRVVLYVVLFLVGGVALWMARQLEGAEQIRLVDVEIVRMAAAQGTQIQRMSTLATALQAGEGNFEENTNALAETIQQAQLQAGQLDELLLRQGARDADGNRDLRSAIAEWQERRERVWYRAQSLLRMFDRPELAKRPDAVRTLQAELESFALTLQTLVNEMQRAAQQRARSAINQIEASVLVMSVLVLALVLGVAEPLVRFVRRQRDDLERQSAELQRLALVAQRTSNWVAVTDRRRGVLWCNDAFLRGKGCRFDEVLGHTPGLLRANAGNDAEEIGRLLTELDYGLGVRAEIMYEATDGREIWLDVDYQPIHDETGQLSGFTMVAADITERVNQRRRMRTLLDALPAGVVQHASNGVVTDCNRVALEMLGLRRDQMIGRPRQSVGGTVVRDDLSPYPAEERPTVRTLRTGHGLRGELVGHMVANGDLHWHMVNTEPLRDAAGHLMGVISCMVDVTQQRDQQQLLTLAIESTSLGIWHWDIPSGKMNTNERMLALFGYAAGELAMESRVFNGLIHPDDRESWGRAIQTNLRDSRQPFHWEMRVRHGSGRWIWTMCSGTVVARDAYGRALRMAGICYDISAQKELEEQLRQSARTDSLTRLPNRSELLNRIHTSMQRARRQPGYCFAVLFMDFDRFKQVNDTLGHSIGDELLRQIAHRLEDGLRPGDAFIQAGDFSQLAARIGGDEFVVLLDNIRGDVDAQVVAARLLEMLAEPYLIGAHRISSTASIGIVTTANMADEPDSVLRDADIAMYEAKRQGRGRYVMFEPSLRKRVHDAARLESDLRQSLALGQLHVVYQPMIDLFEGRLDGVEALVRWQHPQLGLISPLDFIPVAEACGLIGNIGEFVLKSACEELGRLRDVLGEHAPMRVSVNVSRAQLRQPDFVTGLSELLNDSGLVPSHLMLEVTESLAAQDESVQAALHAIRALGVALALDDFGTGYSSLSCLHVLPVNQVKIDRSFVSQAPESDYHRVLIEATIRMAGTLGLQTVAEGIETEAQAVLMKALGCGKGQGYFYSPPLTPQALKQWALAAQGAMLRA